MIGRYALSIVIGVVVTLSLLFVMQLLIASGKAALSEPRARAQLDFVRVKRNENLNTEDFTPEKPPPPPEVPPETPPQEMDSIDPNAPTINIAPPSVSADTNIGGPGGMNIAEAQANQQTVKAFRKVFLSDFFTFFWLLSCHSGPCKIYKRRA